MTKSMSDAPLPFTRRAIKAYRPRIYFGLGLLTTLMSFVLLKPASLLSLVINHKLPDFTALIAPPFIAGLAAAYAGHRYLFAAALR